MAQENIENQPVKSRREQFTDDFYTRYPDMSREDEDARYDRIAQDYADYDKLAQERANFNKLLMENEYAPGLMNGLITKKDEDGNDFNLKEYLKKNGVFADAEDDPTVDAQKVVTEDAELDAAAAEAGLRPEEVADLVEWIYNRENGLLARAGHFELKKEDFKQLLRLKNYDADMSKADEAGYVRGKNEKVDIYKEMDDAEKNAPVSLGGGGGASARKEQDPTLAALDRMSNY